MARSRRRWYISGNSSSSFINSSSSTVTTISSTVYVGIDPGKKGGLCALLPTGRVEYTAVPSTHADTWQWFSSLSKQLVSNSWHCTAVIEQVGGYQPSADKPSDTGSSMFEFGRSYGALEMAGAVLMGQLKQLNQVKQCGSGDLLLFFRKVPPRVWQLALGMRRAKGEQKRQYKSRLVAKARELFPNLVVTNDVGDCLLLAYYARMTNEG